MLRIELNKLSFETERFLHYFRLRIEPNRLSFETENSTKETDLSNYYGLRIETQIWALTLIIFKRKIEKLWKNLTYQTNYRILKLSQIWLLERRKQNRIDNLNSKPLLATPYNQNCFFSLNRIILNIYFISFIKRKNCKPTRNFGYTNSLISNKTDFWTPKYHS